ncbi:MAG: NPXTG-anchored protein [Ruminococcus sp.]|nr:NPXTG-anchored protein [Ruminococcus sp.]
MLKKILAASTAGVLALTAMASAAMADDATATASSDTKLVLVPGTYTTTTEGRYSADITATISGLTSTALANLLAPDVDNADLDTTDRVPALKYDATSLNIGTIQTTAGSQGAGEYSWLDNGGITAATSKTTTPTDIIAVDAGITNGLALVKWVTSGSNVVAQNEKTILAFGSENDSVNPYNNLALGLAVKNNITWTEGTTTKNLIDDIKMNNVTLKVNVVGKGEDVSLSGGVPVTAPDKERKGSATANFGNINKDTLKDPDGTAVNYKVTGPQAAQVSLGLSASKTLEEIKTEDCTIEVSFTLDLSKKAWEAVATASGLNWNVSGASGSTSAWTNLDLEALLNKSGDTIMKNFLAVEGTAVLPWATNMQVGNMAITDFTKVAATNIKDPVDETKTNQNYFNTGVTQSTNGGPITSSNVNVYVGLGTAQNKVLENLNNGGTVTFEFDKDIRPQDVFNPYIIWRGASGLVNLPLQLTNKATSPSAKELQLEFPAGLTWTAGNTNFYNSFIMQFNLNYENLYVLQQGVGSFGGDPLEANTNNQVYGTADRNSMFKDGKDVANKDNYNAKLVKITFAANKEASNGGVVSDPTSNPTSSDPTPSGTTNKGDDSNPGTGVAVAVAPVVLAAAAAAVVISKKRK